MAEAPVVVVGAGLAGLSCARTLHRAGVEVLVLEAGDDVGGRIRTDQVEGFTIDRGFQVLNTGYPALRAAVDLDALDLRALPRGVRVRRRGRLESVPHPFSSPTAALRAATSGAADLRGKVALARYVAGLLRPSADPIKRREDIACGQAWAEHLAPELVDDLLVPFLSGVVLESEATTSRVFTDLMMRMFALGTSAVPAQGMQALPRALAADLPAGTVRTGHPVALVARDHVVLLDGTTIDAAAVVVAADPWTAHRLVPELGEPPVARGVTTYYFAAENLDDDGTLVVDADGSGVVNSVVMTASAPEYSSDGRALVATSVLHDDGVARLGAQAAGEIARTLHPGGATWKLIATRDVPQALPAMTAPHPLRSPTWCSIAGVWVTGDHRDTSSIQGALVSGRRVATSLLRADSNPGRAAA